MPRPLTIRLLIFLCACLNVHAFGQSLISGPGLLQAIATNSCVANNNCNESSQVWITNVSGSQSGGRVTLAFTIAGGPNGLAYDVFASTTLTRPLTNAPWRWMGQGYPNVTYLLPALPEGSNFLLLGTPLDSDNDGLSDAYELLISHSNPYVSNSINPSMLDGWAVLEDLNPFAIYDQEDFPSAPRVRLGYWRFNNGSYTNEDGQLPTVADASLVPDWSGFAVAMTNPGTSSQLTYPVVETNGLTDFNCAHGTIRFWFQPNWTTGSSNAPTNGGNLFLVKTADGSWGLSVVDLGTNTGAIMQFASYSNLYQQPYSFQTGGINGAPVYFRSNLWYQIALTYSPTNIALYTNGILAATGNSPPSLNTGVPLFSAGNGVSYYPTVSDPGSWFSFGCQPGQPCAVRGQLDELESFSYPLTPQAVAAGFPVFPGSTNNIMLDSDYDGRSDLLEMLVDGTNPRDPASVAHCRLGYWRFDTDNWMAEQGQLPLSMNNISLAPSWSGTALNITSDPASEITYWDVFTNGWANINCRQGCLRFWFKPNWTGAPASFAPFVYLGNPNPASSQWTLGVNTAGAITFETASNGIAATHLTSPPQPFNSNHWMQIVLNYGSSGSSLYVNGALAATGSPVTNWPDLADRNLGMVIGNTTAYNDSINGQFDEMETFNYQLDPTNILANFQLVHTVDSDLDGIPDLMEDLVLPAGKPFLGTPVAVAGTVEAEQFDMGGPGVGYFNMASNPPSSYRPTGMFIAHCDDLGQGYCLDQTRAGDWAQYTINVLVPQTYTIETRVEGIGTNGVFECEFVNNTFYTNTGPLVIRGATWTNVSAVVWLTNGIYTMKLRCLTNGTDGAHVGRFNYISIYPWWQAGFTSAYTNSVPGSALSTNDTWTDATNNAAVIQRAINALPVSGGTVLLPSGTYYVSTLFPNESNSVQQNAAVAIAENNVEIAGAGKTNTTLAAYNRATTVFDVGQGFGAAYTNFTLRDMTIQGQPHRAILNITNTVFESGQLQSPDPDYIGMLTLFEGVSESNLTCNVLITNCEFLYANIAVGIPYFVSNCLVTHCDFIMWGGTNINTNAVDSYPTNTLNTASNDVGVAIFCSGSPDYNVNVLENTYNANTNLVPNTNNALGYVNAYEQQLLAPNGFVWFQGGGNYFIARNTILNYETEGVQLNAGPSSVVGNTFYTLLNNASCGALSLNAGEPGLLGTNAVTFSTCFIGNQVYGGRHAVEPQAGGLAPVSYLNCSGNDVTVFPALPQPGSYPGDAANFANCASANVLGNTLASGGHGVVFGPDNGSSIVMNNTFANATYRGVSLDDGGGSAQLVEIINNVIGQGSSFHVELPSSNSFGWFLYKNVYLNTSSNSVPPFIDPISSAVHVTE